MSVLVAVDGAAQPADRDGGRDLCVWSCTLDTDTRMCENVEKQIRFLVSAPGAAVQAK